jgi:hypothetical protein
VPDIRKRVVLLSRSGMHRIVGVFDPSIHEARTVVSFDGVDASLDAVLPRFIVYRERRRRSPTCRRWWSQGT